MIKIIEYILIAFMIFREKFSIFSENSFFFSRNVIIILLKCTKRQYLTRHYKMFVANSRQYDNNIRRVVQRSESEIQQPPVRNMSAAREVCK